MPVYGSPTAMGDAFGVDQHLRTPYMQNFNLNFQQELSRRTVLQIGYVGSNGHKLLRLRDINQPSQAEITAADLACGCINNGTVPRRFSGAPGFSPFLFINYEESSANSNYNALQTSLRVNDWRGFTSTLNYVWSHSIDDASDGEEFVPNASQPNDSPSAHRSRIAEIRTLTFATASPGISSINFPIAKADWQRVTDGWGLNGIVTVQAGQPFSVNYFFTKILMAAARLLGAPMLSAQLPTIKTTLLSISTSARLRLPVVFQRAAATVPRPPASRARVISEMKDATP